MEIGEWADMLTWLTRGLARGDLAHGSLLADVFLRWGKLVFDSWWIFILIWVPLIMVPDSSSRAFGGVRAFLQRLFVEFGLCWVFSQPVVGACFLGCFF
jgi:hypothetical protein